MVSPEELADEFAGLNDFVDESDAGAAPQRLVDLARVVIQGCRCSAITAWPRNSRPRTVASAGALSPQVDRIQYAAGEGPCLSADSGHWTAWAPDLEAEARWPVFVASVLSDTPVRGVLSFDLPGTGERHALSLYAVQPGVFDKAAVATGVLFASHAGVLLAHSEVAERTAGLREALSSSRQIGVAVGMVMATYHVSDKTAFAVLRRTSNELNRKLRDVADEVSETGKLPRE